MRIVKSRRNLVIGAVAVVVALIVASSLLALTQRHDAKPATTAGIEGLTGVAAPSGPEASASTSPVMSTAAYKGALARDRLRLLKIVAWVARAGAGGKISDSAFTALSDDAETATIAWSDVAPPASLTSITRRWNAAIGRAYTLAEPATGVTRDLRGVKQPMQALLADLVAVRVPGGSTICSRIAADLQRGLWVTRASAISAIWATKPVGAARHAFSPISFGVLNRDAASLVGHRYVIRSKVLEINDAGAGGYYWPDYPKGIQPRIEMWVDMTDKGYGIWDNEVAVICNGALKHVHKNSIVTIYGTCLGRHSYPTAEGYDLTMPLIHAKFVASQ